LKRNCKIRSFGIRRHNSDTKINWMPSDIALSKNTTIGKINDISDNGRK
jgi:hypothetical protein